MPWCRIPYSVFALIFVACSLFANTAQAERIWRISTFDYRPLAYKDDEGRYTGVIAETIKAICAAAEIRCSHRLMPYKRAEQQILAGQLDATVTINTGNPKACCDHGAWQTDWSAGFYSTTPNARLPKSAEDLKGRSLIVVHGMESPYQFAPKLQEWADAGLVSLHKATSIETSIRMLLHGRADLLWGANDFSWFFQKLNNGVVPTFQPKFTFPIVFWTSKQSPELLEKLDLGFQRLKNSNALNASNLVPYKLH